MWMIGKWTLRTVSGLDPDSPVRATDPTLEKGATMSTDSGVSAPKPPERYDVRVVLDGDEAEALNYVRQYLTARTGGAINVTVSDAIRFALKSSAWALQPDEGVADGQ
jgi:hypothetical protein